MNAATLAHRSSLPSWVEWMSECIAYLRARGYRGIAAIETAEPEWQQYCKTVIAGSLFPTANSWFMGANIAGKNANVPRLWPRITVLAGELRRGRVQCLYRIHAGLARRGRRGR